MKSRVIRLARDAELELDDEGGRTHLEAVEREVRRRRRSDVVRLEIEAAASRDSRRLLFSERLDLDASKMFIPSRARWILRVLSQLTDLPGFDELRDPPLQPADVLVAARARRYLLDSRRPGTCCSTIPTIPTTPCIALLDQAADDPDVLAIKQTLYRTSVGSPLIASLQRAAESRTSRSRCWSS